ncbi:aldehyde dehydrogenase family protein, partial [Saccharopolyspora kobensis]
MTILDTERWAEQVFTGRWQPASGTPAEVVEPATGKLLGHVGRATPADVDQACAKAAAAQRLWEDTPFDE